ncbi:MAG TPA: hypothetical protein VGP68_23115 [Gemmataceae bacterium]|nr:hypothetical protein [Gemmataceae bacterium]
MSTVQNRYRLVLSLARRANSTDASTTLSGAMKFLVDARVPRCMTAWLEIIKQYNKPPHTRGLVYYHDSV